MDSIALQHDIDYTGALNEADLIKADDKAIDAVMKLPFSLEKIAMIVGLKTRQALSKIGINVVKPGKNPAMKQFLDDMVQSKPADFAVIDESWGAWG